MTEQEFLSSLDKHERRYLSCKICGLCEKHLHRPGCGSMWETPCNHEVQIRRAKDCLKYYKPRLSCRNPK